MNEQVALQAADSAFKQSTLPTRDVVLRYKDMVYSIALTHTRTRQDADDVFQEVFLVYHRKNPVFSSEELRKAWLITTTVNCARQQTSSSWAKKVVPLYDQQLSSSEVSDDFSFANALQDEIFQAMRELPGIYRTVLHLFYFEDMSVDSIAQVLEIAPGTVRVQLSRGRAQMKTLLKGANSDE
ncbi:MAG: sigma-70 family RNA polymerase sigma factor [Coriobacteriia bacterium]|nr:sigma-70 family RNA polymerase sigma factor [Coriobacteriia bacterium]